MTNDEHVPGWRPLSPPEEAGVRDGTLPAHVANGLIGLRVRGWWPAPFGKGGDPPSHRVPTEGNAVP